MPTTRSRHSSQKMHYIELSDKKKPASVGTAEVIREDRTKVTDLTNIPTAQIKKPAGRANRSKDVQKPKGNQKVHYVSISEVRRKDSSPSERPRETGESLADNEVPIELKPESQRSKEQKVKRKKIRNILIGVSVVVLVATATAVGIFMVFHFSSPETTTAPTGEGTSS